MKYTEDHEWLRAEGNEIVIGITQHAAEQLGDVVFVELPEVGDTAAKGDELATIESVKAAAEINAPFDIEVVAVNEKLAENPELVNEDPLGEAWFVRVRVDDTSVVDDYLEEESYRELVE
ncbi:MAG: glycine cleavage system protein GcvH [Albidovulum sp.]|nr:glycine cleavage system protein GcvH [Albidovulum sp.]